MHQAQLSHTANPASKTFVYRNLVHADNWMTTVREKLDDPAYSGFFVPFKRGGSLSNGTWHVPACDNAFSPPKCSPLFHDQVNTPQHNPRSKTPLVKVQVWVRLVHDRGENRAGATRARRPALRIAASAPTSSYYAGRPGSHVSPRSSERNTTFQRAQHRQRHVFGDRPRTSTTARTGAHTAAPVAVGRSGTTVGTRSNVPWYMYCPDTYTRLSLDLLEFLYIHTACPKSLSEVSIRCD